MHGRTVLNSACLVFYSDWLKSETSILNQSGISLLLILLDVRSHGSGFLRQGAVVFGIGSFIYHLLEFITYFIIDLHPNCLDIVHTVISFLAIIFILLQTVTIIMYPRLNIQLANGIPHLGLMHVVATNLILWMRTVIRESFHAFHEATELKLNSPLINVNLTSHFVNSSSGEDIRESIVAISKIWPNAENLRKLNMHRILNWIPNIISFWLNMNTE